MENNIKVEEWLGNEIRFVEVNGEWWAIAKDVAKALDIKNVSDFTSRLDAEDKGVVTTDTLGGKQKVNIISEFGIYEAIFNSRKPEAKEFKKWVKQVIKSLRKSVGLEQYEVFEMMRKENMKVASDKLRDGLEKAEDKDFRKAHEVANKAVSTNFGFKKRLYLNEMTPEMKMAREPIYNDTVDLIIMQEKMNLDISISKTIYGKYCK
ncbi:BRO-N domain-containing protein [Staphylococcus cohnii]|uniref:BRO-N domain-containing protein n=1 Tax=Staphylococcus cohnii TaxID=29382 RepID=UPI003D7D0371